MAKGRTRGVDFMPMIAAATLAFGCNDGVDAAKASAYFDALQKQSDFVAERAGQICSDPNVLSQHSAIQGLLRDLNQYRIDFEGQVKCTKKNQCDPPQRQAKPPPVFRAPPAEPNPKGAALSKDTCAKLRELMADKPPKPFRDALLKCQSEAMSVAASAAVLITTCTTRPESAAEKRDTARLEQARQEFADALKRARKAAKQ